MKPVLLSLKTNFDRVLDEFNEIYETCAEYLRKTKATPDFYYDQATEKVLNKIKRETPSSIRNAQRTAQTLNTDVKIKKFLSSLDFYWREHDFGNVSSINKRKKTLRKLLARNDKVFHQNLQYLLEALRVLPPNVMDTLSLFILDVVFLGIQTYIIQMLFVINQYACLANHYIQLGEILKYNKYYDKSYLYLEQEKRQLFGENGRVGFMAEVRRYFESRVELKLNRARLNDLDTFERLLNLPTLWICVEQPAKIVEKPDFSQSKIQTPIGVWESGGKVSYAIQYFDGYVNSKISEWSEPVLVADKANPKINLPQTAYEGLRLILRKFEGKKPEIVGIVEDSNQTDFYDIDHDLFDAAANYNNDQANNQYRTLLENGANPRKAFVNGSSVIHAAAFARNVQLIEDYLTRVERADINVRDSKGFTALHIAAGNGNEELVRLLLAHDADVNAKTKDHEFTPMHIAAFRGHGNVLEILLDDKRAPAEMPQDAYGCTPLHCAVFGGAAAINVLLENAVFDVNAKCQAGLTALHLAVINRDIDAAKALLRHNAVDAESTGEYNLRPLHMAVIAEDVEMLANLLSVRIVDVNANSIHDWTALHMATTLANVSLVSELLRHSRINLNAESKNGLTPLHIAAKTDQGYLVDCFLQHGATLNAQTEWGFTPLHLTAKFGCTNALKTLVQHGADMGLTPLLLAAQSKTSSTATLKYLLENGADAQATDDLGLTFECLAAQRGSREIVRYLVENYKGGDFTDMHGNNLLHHAVEGGNFDVVSMLVCDFYFNVKALNTRQQSVLHLAADQSTIDFLLDHQADIDAVDSKQLTPLTNAFVSRRFDIFKYLVQRGAALSYRDAAKVLHSAAILGNSELIRFLIEEMKLHPNIRSVSGNTLLFSAARCGKLDVVKYFREQCQIGVYVQNKDDCTALHEAALQGDLDIVRYLVKEDDAVVNVKDKLGATALFYAARSSSLSTVKFLLEAGADINDKDQANNSLLHYAARGGNMAIIQFLVHWKNFDPIAKNRNDELPVFLAAQYGKLDAIKYFLEDKQVGLENKNCFDATILLAAARYAPRSMVKYLLKDQGANFKAKTKNGATAACWAARDNCLNVLKFILKCGADINDKDSKNNNLLHFAARGGNMAIIKFLVDEKNFEPNDKNVDGETPFLQAAQFGKFEAVKYFIKEKKVGLEYHGILDDMLLKIAASTYHQTVASWFGPRATQSQDQNIDRMKFLLENGADINFRDSQSNSILHYAAQGGDMAIIKFLVEEKGFNPNDESRWKRNSLFAAAESGNLDTVIYFVQVQAINIQSIDIFGRTILQLAALNGHFHIVSYLVEELGAEIETKYRFGQTALLAAAQGNSFPIIKFLLEKGANIHDMDNKNDNLFHYAAKNGNMTIIKFLVNEKCLDPNDENFNDQLPVFRAAHWGKLEAVRYFIEETNIDVNDKTNINRIAFLEAIKNGHLNVVNYFKDKPNLNWNKPYFKGKTPMELLENIIELNDIQ